MIPSASVSSPSAKTLLFMSVTNTPKNILLVVGLILIAAGSRLLPHWPNFVPVGAMALFGAAALPKRWLAVIVPVLAFYLSDLTLNNTLYAEYYEGFHWGINYWTTGAIVFMVILGMGLLRNTKFSWPKIGGAAVGATLVFFLVTNFGVWASGMMYPKSGAGLMAAYTAGLPFLLNSLLANLLFSGVLFGVAQYGGIFAGAGTLERAASGS
jgi:hypothetical protein